jgi:hypothetical protein
VLVVAKHERRRLLEGVRDAHEHRSAAAGDLVGDVSADEPLARRVVHHFDSADRPRRDRTQQLSKGLVIER